MDELAVAMPPSQLGSGDGEVLVIFVSTTTTD
jgi:hypothetical protein